MGTHVDSEAVGCAVDEQAQGALGERPRRRRGELEHPVAGDQSLEVAIVARHGDLDRREPAPLLPAVLTPTARPAGATLPAPARPAPPVGTPAAIAGPAPSGSPATLAAAGFPTAGFPTAGLTPGRTAGSGLIVAHPATAAAISARSSSVRSVRVAAALAVTCSGADAPAITEAVAGLLAR